MSHAAVIRGRRAWRYAQEKGGQQLHLAELDAAGNTENVSLCGRVVKRWRMTINLPLNHACKRCWKARVLRDR